MTIKAVCLDIDGTLYPKWMMYRSMVSSTFPDISVSMKYNRTRKLYRQVQDDYEQVPVTRDEFVIRQALLVSDSLDGARKLASEIDHQIYRRWEKSFLSIKPYENMAACLYKAKERGLKIAILSDFPVASKPETLGIDRILDFAMSAEDTGFLKPSRVPFEVLLEKIGLRPEECVYIGDSYSKDIAGSRSAGMINILLSRKKGDFPDADCVCRDWFEIERELDRLTRG